MTSARRRPAEPDLILGRYLVRERLGAGAFGVVWRAWDSHLEREVALKEIHTDPGGIPFARVEREARAAARLAHPAIVALYELGRDDDAVYLVFELVRGRGLAELLALGLVSDRDLARIGAVLCDALAHAHARGVVHRDVKPHNVIVAAEPAAGAGWAKLTDFGVAHLAAGETLTGTGEILGTLAYMAPEQAGGQAVTGAADVYGLALTLYEGWAGTNPLRGEGPLGWARQAGRPLPQLRTRRRDLPPALGRAVDAALDPRPECRPSPQDLRAALEEVAPLLDGAGGLETAAARGIPLEAQKRRDEPRPDQWPRSPEPETRVDQWPRSPEPETRVDQWPRSPEPEPKTRVDEWPSEAEPLTRFDDWAPARGPEPPPEPRARHAGLVRWARRLGLRAAAAGLAGGAVGLALAHLDAPQPRTLGAAAAASVLLLPRFGWLASAAAVLAWLALGPPAQPGAALVLLPVLLLAPLLLPGWGAAWSLPLLAPVAGALGAPALYLGIAGRPGGLWRRGALGAAGALAVLAGEALRGPARLLAETPGRGWEESVPAALDDVVLPLAAGPAGALAAGWALLAAGLPVLVRGGPRTRVVGAAAWATASVLVHVAVADQAALGQRPEVAGGAVVGSLGAAALAALLPRAPSPERDRPGKPLWDGPRAPSARRDRPAEPL